jgi:succinate dehydrogenase/fumarate reductase flavoprotein subunit
MSRVLVLGCGYAGAVAALAAADAGARVLLVEKNATPGGISVCSAGGLRIARDARRAFAYLQATCGGKTPDDVLQVLAVGMTLLPQRLARLAEGQGARIDRRDSPGNYPFPGSDTFGFAYVEAIAGFDPEAEWPHVRGNPQGALLFRLLERALARRPGIELRLGVAAERLLSGPGGVTGVRLADGTEHAGPVVLATGGFEADPGMQAQYWPGGPMLPAAYAGNTGDGIRMAQAAGADLWHMWHSHACYGFALPGYPFGVRVKRLPDWLPGPDGMPDHDVPPVAWVLLDRDGRRFMNEYEPYLQDTGARRMGDLDPARMTMPRSPSWFVTDAAGLALYPMGKPTWHHASARWDWSAGNGAEVDAGLFRRAEDAAALAAVTGADAAVLAATLAGWAGICATGRDPLGRPPSSLRPLAPPYYAAPVVQVVSNTQGGPRHDAGQRVLDPFGQPIRGLWAAGECGSAFGHLYLSGGNIAECFVGGEIAGTAAARAALEDPK